MNDTLCEVRRGGIRECVHRGAAAVVAGRKLLYRKGDVSEPTFMRSCAKPFQSHAVVESGAADAFGFGDPELAVMSGSHLGGPDAVGAVRRILEKAGLGPERLQCGTHEPLSGSALKALHVAGEEPAVLHNNCSGKHAGMVAAAKHLGAPLETYLNPSHPVQKRNRATLARFAGMKAAQLKIAVDGCSAPTFALGVRAMAQAMASFCEGPPGRIARAMMAHPALVGRPCADFMKSAPGRLIAKLGAEGVYVIGLPGRGIGIAMKVHDGSRRPIVPFLAALLAKLKLVPRLGGMGESAITNHAGRSVGEIRVVL